MFLSILISLSVILICIALLLYDYSPNDNREIRIDKLIEYEKKWDKKKPDYKPRNGSEEERYWNFYKLALIEAKMREGIRRSENQ